MTDAERVAADLERFAAETQRIRKVDLVADAASASAAEGLVKVSRSGEVGKVDDPTRRAMCRLASVYELSPIWQAYNGQGVRVAMLDTGLAFDHPLLKDTVALDRQGKPICRSFLGPRDDRSEGDEAACLDKDGHGTHGAGVVAARSVPGMDSCRGIAPETKLVIAKVLNDNGEGRIDALADAVVWAASRADILNLSLISMQSSDRLYRAIQGALSAGCTVVCAAGNYGGVPGELAYPARYGGVISVAAHDAYGQPVRFSSRGGEIDFAALGEDVWSTSVHEGEPTISRASGTSIAAPVVTGMASLILAKHRLFERLHDEAKRDPDPAKQAAAGRFVNNTPIRNNEDMREHLMRLASSRNAHRDDLGYGPLWPTRLLYS